jgi:hypothetical protein
VIFPSNAVALLAQANVVPLIGRIGVVVRPLHAS